MSTERKGVDDVLPEHAKAWTMRESAHINGGSAFFAYLFQCNQEPRLERFDRYDRKTRSVTSTWRVDGKDQESLQDAFATLASDPLGVCRFPARADIRDGGAS